MFKALVVASAGGYVSKFEVYQGSNYEVKDASNLGPTANTVLHLCEGLEGSNRKLYVDNLFISISLVQELLQKICFCCWYGSCK